MQEAARSLYPDRPTTPSSIPSIGVKQHNAAMTVPVIPTPSHLICFLAIAYYPAQQDSCDTSLAKVCAHNFNPSTMVK
jgi:hypothetical protein